MCQTPAVCRLGTWPANNAPTIEDSFVWGPRAEREWARLMPCPVRDEDEIE